MAASVSGDTPEWFHVPNARVAARPQTHSPRRGAGGNIATQSEPLEAPGPSRDLLRAHRRSFTMTNPVSGLQKRSRAPQLDSMVRSVDMCFLDKRRYRNPRSFERRHASALQEDGHAFHRRKGSMQSFMEQANVNRNFLASLPSRSRGEVDEPPPSFQQGGDSQASVEPVSCFGSCPPVPRRRATPQPSRRGRRGPSAAEKAAREAAQAARMIQQFEVKQHASIDLSMYTKHELRALLVDRGVAPPDVVVRDAATGEQRVELARKREYLALARRVLRASEPDPVHTRGCKLGADFYFVSLFEGALGGVRVQAYSAVTSREYKLGLTASQLRDAHLLPPPDDTAKWAAWSPPLLERLAVVDGKLELVDPPLRANGLPVAFSLASEDVNREVEREERPPSRQNIAAFFKL